MTVTDSAQQFFTVGVFGTTRDSFFEALESAGITHFVDVRQRRGMRGAQYSYVNATALQESLGQIGIVYTHMRELAPTPETRSVQKARDRAANQSKSSREALASDFILSYNEQCLDDFDPQAFARRFPLGARVVIFCVERRPEACHRSLIAASLGSSLGIQVPDITP